MNTIKLVSNIGMLVYYNMNRMILEVYDSIAMPRHKPNIEDYIESWPYSTLYNSKRISKEDNSKHSSKEVSNEIKRNKYVPYDGPYSETP